MKQNTKLSSFWLLVFFMICYSVAAFGAQFSPGDWYQELQRAPWSPPNIAFPILWTILYAMIAIAGWRVFSTGDPLAKTLWIIQLVLNGAWSWIFFGEHWVAVALSEIIFLLFVVSWLVLRCNKLGARSAVWLLMPYLIWLALATSLNAYIVIFN